MPNRLIYEFATNPFFTIKNLSESMKASYTTVQRAVEKLEELKIVFEVTKNKRNRVYCAKEILTILEEPIKIKLHE